MTSAGQLTVRAQFKQGRLELLGVDLNRPPVARLFIDQAPEAVVKTVPYLYTLCAHAQRAAAQGALAAAQGETPRPLRDGELWIEFLHENFWRLLLDWPVALGVAPANEAFIAWRALRQGEQCIDETEKLLAGPLHALAERCLEQLADDQPAPPGHFPALAPETWLTYWQGCADLPPLPQPTSIAAAYRRRLAETTAASAALTSGTSYPVATAGDKGWAVGQTLTARGVLTHAVQVDEALVKKYRVWAPTDHHFADANGLTALLAGRSFDNIQTARHVLEQAILALDPCLPYTLEVSHA